MARPVLAAPADFGQEASLGDPLSPKSNDSVGTVVGAISHIQAEGVS